MNSGLGVSGDGQLPAELRGFSWAAFLWGGIWALAYGVWIGVLAFVPFFGFIMNVVLGVKGAEWAYRKGAIPDLAKYKKAQQTWVIVWAVLTGVMMVGVVPALAIFGVKQYITQAKRAEAKNTLAALTKGMASCGARSDMPETSAWIPSDLSSVSGLKYQAGPSEWSSQPAFACAGFVFSGPQYFRYRWVQATTASGQFEAEADLNGDGIADNAMQQGLHCVAGTCEVEPLLGDTPGSPR